jgi:hypothetical protein
MRDPHRPPRDRPWVVIFILLSLLAHLLFVLAIVVVGQLVPTPKFHDEPQLSSTTLSLEQPLPPPPPPPTPPRPHHLFMPTEPDAEAKHQQSAIESDNDTRLKSQSQVARDANSLMPDVNVQRKHASDLNNSPNAPSKQKPHLASASTPQTQPAPKAAPQPPSPSPQAQPRAAQAQKPQQNPSPTAKQEQAHPAQSPTPQVAQEQLDPNGLPVLPALNAPTIAPASQHEEATVAASNPLIAQSAHGAIGAHGANSVAAMATELGRYKAKVYRAVGSRWYNKVDQQLQVLPVGTVHIQFTIHADGTVDTKVLDGDTGPMQLLLSVSLNSIREAAPFDPFTPSMIKELGADEYTDDFTFSIYGGGD